MATKVGSKDKRASQRNRAMRENHMRKKLDNSDAFRHQFKGDAESPQVTRADPFQYGRKKSIEGLRDTEWVEKLNDKKLELREINNVVFADSATKSSIDIAREAISKLAKQPAQSSIRKHQNVINIPEKYWAGLTLNPFSDEAIKYCFMEKLNLSRLQITPNESSPHRTVACISDGYKRLFVEFEIVVRDNKVVGYRYRYSKNLSVKENKHRKS